MLESVEWVAWKVQTRVERQQRRMYYNTRAALGCKHVDALGWA